MKAKNLTSERGRSRLKIDDMVEAEVFKITSFGAFVKLTDGRKALIHISQVADNFVKNINDHLKIGDIVKARILSIERDKIDLTLKKPKEDVVSYPKGKEFRSSFEEKLEGFLTER